MNKPIIIGSLTTIPSRINNIEPTVRSLLEQSRPLDKIYINIPLKSKKGKKYIIPSFLSKLESDKFVINRCEEDYGAITKLLPTLDHENRKNTYIITFDDDWVMDKDVIKIFSYKIKQYPNCALSFSGYCAGTFPHYMQRFVDNEHDQETDWIQGCHGICYPRHLINKKDILQLIDELPGFMKRHDDHIVATYLSKNNVKRIVIKGNVFAYFKPQEHCMVNAISGGDSTWNTIIFFTEVTIIAMYLKYKGIYTTTGDIFSLQYVLLWISILCIFVYKSWYNILVVPLLYLAIRSYYRKGKKPNKYDIYRFRLS